MHDNPLLVSELHEDTSFFFIGLISNLEKSASGFSCSTLNVFPKNSSECFYQKLLGVNNLPTTYKARYYTAYDKSGR